MPAVETAPVLHTGSPYPGLRSFEPHESFLFHGRESHTQELLARLANHRFLAVVGTSGSGKSSLVRAGLLPDSCPRSIADSSPAPDPAGESP